MQRRPGTFLVNDITSTATRSFYSSSKLIPFKTPSKNLVLVLNSGAISNSWIYNADTGSLNALTVGAELTGVEATTIPNNIASEIQYAQFGENLLITHRLFRPLVVSLRFLSSSGYYINSWNFSPLSYGTKEVTQTVPYLEVNLDDNQGQGELQASATSGTITLTSTKGIFNSGHVGARFKLTRTIATAQTGLVRITGVTNAFTATAQVDPLFPLPVTTGYGVTTGYTWEEQAWSTYRGWPRACAYFQSKLWVAGTLTHPNRVWATATGDLDEWQERPYAQYPEFATYTDDTSRAFSFDVSASQVNNIKWLKAGKRLFVGAEDGEAIISSSDGLYKVGSIIFEGATSFGSREHYPVKIDNNIIFLPSTGGRVRNLVFSFQEDEYKSDDIAQHADHIAGKTYARYTGDDVTDHPEPFFTDICLQRSPDARLWLLDDFGGLSSCTIDSKNNIRGWSSHKLGGTGPSGFVRVLSICSVPSRSRVNENLLMICERTINGVVKITLEIMLSYFKGKKYTNTYYHAEAGYGFQETLAVRPLFTDCSDYSISYISKNNIFSFINHINETVEVIADGMYLGSKKIDGSGNLDLSPNSYNEVIIGYKYESVLETVDFDIANSPQSLQGLTKNATEIWVRFNKTHNALMKKSTDASYESFKFLNDSSPTNMPVLPLFTGDKRMYIGGMERNLSIKIKQDQPFPWEVIAIIMNGQSY